MMKLPRLKKQQRGVAAVEFGILIIPMLIMLIGLTEYGRAIYQYNTLAKSVRNATRYLTTVAPGNTTEQLKAKCLAVYGNLDCAGTELAQNLETTMVYICDSIDFTDCTDPHSAVPTGQGAVNLVTVSIRDFEFVSLFNFTLGGHTFGNIPFDDIGNTMRQAL